MNRSILSSSLSCLSRGVLLCSVVLIGAGASTSTAQPWLDTVMENVIAQHHVPSISAAVIDGDTTTVLDAWGDARVTPQIDATTDTVYLVASVSKTIVATALMQQVDAGAIGIDDPIQPHLPFTLTHPNFPASSITPRMLLSHTTGIDDNWSIISITFGADPSVPLATSVENYFVPGMPWYSPQNFLNIQPGTQHHYANMNFTLAALLVEELSGEDFAAYTQTHIFDPLGMDATSWSTTQQPAGTSNAIGYNYTPSSGVLSPWNIFTSNLIWPAGWVRTTPRDMTHFLTAHMNDGTFQSTSILDPATVATMHSAQPGSPAYGLGFWKLVFSPAAGGNVVGHDGSLPGVTTLMYYSPADERGIIMFLNVRRETDPTGLTAAINSIIFGLYSTCQADCDGSSTLNILDFICFGDAFAAQHQYADCDMSGSLNILDYICFGDAFAGGCP